MSTLEIVPHSIASLPHRFDDMDAYFAKLKSHDVAKFYSGQCSDWLIAHPDRMRIDYDPFTPLSHQPGCVEPYFNLLAECGVTSDAEEYLTTRSWFMQGTVCAPLLLYVALCGRGQFVCATAGNFPEDLYYIMSAQ
jgi:hypothetical protein